MALIYSKALSIKINIIRCGFVSFSSVPFFSIQRLIPKHRYMSVRVLETKSAAVAGFSHRSTLSQTLPRAIVIKTYVTLTKAE